MDGDAPKQPQNTADNGDARTWRGALRTIQDDATGAMEGVSTAVGKFVETVDPHMPKGPLNPAGQVAVGAGLVVGAAGVVVAEVAAGAAGTVVGAAHAGANWVKETFPPKPPPIAKPGI